MSSPGEYSMITSNDGETFIVETKLLPGKFPTSLPYTGQIVERVMEYLHYKNMYQLIPQKKVPPFHMEPAEALDVLRAAI